MNPLSAHEKRSSVIAVSAAIVAICAAAPDQSEHRGSRGTVVASPREPDHGPDLESLKLQVVEAHNRIRTGARLPTLEVSERLHAAAEFHALDMATRCEMTHKGRKGSGPFDRIKAKGYPYRRAGENIAAGRYTVDELMKIWMDSPPHKKNILGGFSQIGVGCATGEDGKRYWCVTFGLPVHR
jgi:uncharacterized protein YkwD